MGDNKICDLWFQASEGKFYSILITRQDVSEIEEALDEVLMGAGLEVEAADDMSSEARVHLKLTKLIETHGNEKK